VGGTLAELSAAWVVAAMRSGTAQAGLAARGAGAAANASHGVDWGQILTTAGIWAGLVGAVAGVIAIIPMTRSVALRVWRMLLMRAGLPYYRYAKKFIKEYGSYENPYLGEYEKIDLRTTYVPLSFQAEDAQSYAIATGVLTELPVGRRRGGHLDGPGDRLIIVGDPGSGKSTLLRAYGVGAAEGSSAMAGRTRVVPYFVRLRELAKFTNSDRGLTEFIVTEVLKQQGFFEGNDRARAFFARTVSRRQAAVLLDGLDEVPDDRQLAVLGAIRRFLRDKSEDCPTERVTMLLTCRSQNFEVLRDKWIPAVARADRLYTLAPLRDSEIVGYVRKFRHKFKTPDGPAQFMRSVRGSGRKGTDRTIELLRAPLVLSMAVGLYAHRPARIPNTIAKLYHAMIEEMLERHGFLQEAPEDTLLRFRMTDKYRFLRWFALHAVQKSGTFSDFTMPELIAFSTQLAPSLEAVEDPAGLVGEIIKHSNLLTPLEHSDLYFFAHRSIQEFLAAEQLQHQPDGDAFLLDRSTDMNWRQAILFYTAGREPAQVDEFITKLAARNSDLAAYCLRAAGASDEAAAAVLDALNPITDARVNALAAASRSPRVPVRRMAIAKLKEFITDRKGALSVTVTSIDDMLPLLESLADTNAGEIAALVPDVIRTMPDDPRLVTPLWQCLSADGIEVLREECAEIVRRLLRMAIDPDAFNALAEADPGDRGFLADLRGQAYPFKRGLPADHNLVTLLAWAEYLNAAPPDGNRFLEARYHGRLRTVEADLRRTIVFPLCWLARVVSSVELTAATAAAIFVLAFRPGLLLHPFGWWTLILIIGIAAAPMVLFITLTAAEGSWYSINDANGGNWLLVLYNAYLDSGAAFAMTIIGIPLIFAAAGLIFMQQSLAIYIVVALASQLAFWLTSLDPFSAGRHYYLHLPNSYVDVYTDQQSRLWLGHPGPGL
jgi:hypothetical protein